MCIYINKEVCLYTEISIWYFPPIPQDAHDTVNPLAFSPKTLSKIFLNLFFLSAKLCVQSLF